MSLCLVLLVRPARLSAFVFGTIFSPSLSVRTFSGHRSLQVFSTMYVLYKESCFFRFLSWAIHVFAYDLAYEPDGWPWRPVRSIKYNFLFSFNCFNTYLSDWILCWAHTRAGNFWNLRLWSKQRLLSSLISSSTHFLCHHFVKRHHSTFSFRLFALVETLR